MTAGSVRPPAVAGAFYPGEADALRRTCDALLGAAEPPTLDIDVRMLIVPHAGYRYSGEVAAAAYRLVGGALRVLLIGPAHFEGFPGLAAPGHDGLATPLGTVPVDTGLRTAVAAPANPGAHRREHSLEVQLPFLQRALEDFSVLPVLTGDLAAEAAAEALDVPADLTVVSSDLSHYLDYDAACRRDRRTAAAIVDLRADDVDWDDACGSTAVRAALVLARRRSWRCHLLDLRNSGDTAGGRRRVVGYGAFALGPVS